MIKKIETEKADKHEGFIALFRKIIKHKIFFNEKHLRIFIWLLCSVAWKEHWAIKYEKRFLIQKGEIYIRWEDLSEELGYSKSTLRRYIGDMAGEMYDHIITKRNEGVCICIKVNNYGKWQ